MTDDAGAKVFDMPHARVTLTPVGSDVEIEVWPKAGQSAYAVVDPTVAILIARHLVELAAAQLAAAQGAGADEGEDDADGGDEQPGDDDGRGTIVDLASRRHTKGGAAS